MESPIITARELAKTYDCGQKAVEAVRGTDLEMDPGQIFGLVGPDGAGKTTTIQMLFKSAVDLESQETGTLLHYWMDYISPGGRTSTRIGRTLSFLFRRPMERRSATRLKEAAVTALTPEDGGTQVTFTLHYRLPGVWDRLIPRWLEWLGSARAAANIRRKAEANRQENCQAAPQVTKFTWKIGGIMSNKRLLRWLGAFLLLDGVSLLTFGRTYVRLWQADAAPSPYRRAMAWLAQRSNWLLRAAGVAETGLGLAALRKAPVDVLSLYHVAAGLYDTAAPTWRDWLYRDAHRAFDHALASHLPADGHVLDLACGTAANLERLLALELPFATYTGVDLSPDMLARARAKFGYLGNVTFMRRNLLVDPLPEGPFDLVVSTWAFEHLPDPGKVVEKAWTHLQPGGHIVLLFEADSGTWRSRVVDGIWRLFSARLLPEDDYHHFPGVVSANHFGGALGPLALVVLHRPEALRK